jgi:hypothetical protein
LQDADPNNWRPETYVFHIPRLIFMDSNSVTNVVVLDEFMSVPDFGFEIVNTLVDSE